MSDIGMSLNGSALDSVNGFRAEGVKLTRTEAKVSDAKLNELGMTQSEVETELTNRLGDGDVSASDLAFMGKLSGDGGIQVSDFMAAGFDVTSAQFMFRFAKQEAPTADITGTAVIDIKGQPKETEDKINAYLQQASGGKADGQGNPVITRSTMEKELGQQLTVENTAPPTANTKPGAESALYKHLTSKGFDHASACDMCAQFQAGVKKSDEVLPIVATHTETKMGTEKVLVSQRTPTDDEIAASMPVSPTGEINEKFNNRSVSTENTFATGEAMGGDYWQDPRPLSEQPYMDQASPAYDAEAAERTIGLVQGVQKTTATIAKTYAPVVNGQQTYDVDAFHQTLTASFPDAGFTCEDAERFLKLAVNGIDTKDDCAFLNAFVRQTGAPAIVGEMDRPLWTATAPNDPKQGTQDEIDMRVINGLLAIDNIVTTPQDPVYETRETDVTFQTDVTEQRNVAVESDFSIAVKDGKPLGTLETKSYTGASQNHLK
jgi:hypothetical protein